MRQIRVLQFTLAAGKGGPTQYILNNWKYIDRARFQFDFITFARELDYERPLQQEGCRIYHISCYPEKDKKQFVKELDNILDHGYDVMHIHTTAWKDTIVEERAKAKGVRKIIIHAHTTGCVNIVQEEQRQEEEYIHYSIRNKISKELATDYWACSGAAAEWLYGDRIDRKYIKIMNNAIDLNRFAYNETVRQEVRHAVGLDSKFVIGHVGRLEYIKNHIFLLQILSHISRRIPEAVLLLVGDGRLHEDIKRKADKLGLSDRVIMLGRRDDTERWYQAMDVFALPSLSEAAPLVLLEAQTSGLACICSENVSNEFFYTGNVQKICLSAPEDWATALIRLSNGYERRDQSAIMRKAGFDIKQQVKELEKEYEEI